jgi:uncharacterized protein (DUF2062 family)
MSGRLRRGLEILLHVEDTPHRIALAFGIGVWIAFFPIWGIHTVMALAIAFAFRLSRAAMVIGAYVNNPWTMGPMYLGGTLLGCALLGVSTEGLASLDWDSGKNGFVKTMLQTLRPYLWPFVVGNTVAGIVAGAAGYGILRTALERRRRAA